VGTITRVYDYLRALCAGPAPTHCRSAASASRG
jgi:hypothetical protein